MAKIAFFSFLFFILFLFSFGEAQSPSLLITEVQIAGQSSSNDFIEIYNPGGSSLNITGFKLRKRTKTGSEYSIRVFPEGSTISAKGYFLWANSKEGYNETLGADVASTQTLAKNNSLAFLDPENNIIDSLAWGTDLVDPFGEGTIFPENPETNQSLERKFLNGAYQDTNDNANDFVLNNNPNPQGSGGQTPPEPEPEPVCQPAEEICDGIDNDCNDLIDEDLGQTTCGIGACEVTVANCIDGVAQTCIPGTPTEEICDQIDNNCDGQVDEDDVCQPPEPPATEETPTEFGQTPSESTPPAQPEPQPIIYPSNIYINEFLPSPEGPDAEEEWLELYSSNAVAVDLSDWSIEDTQGSTKSYTFPEGTTIGSQGFLILDRPTSKIVLNNDGEGLVLKNPLGEVVNSVSYQGNAPQGQSYARKNNGTWQWTSALTPGEENRFPLPPEPETQPESQPSGTPEEQQEETGTQLPQEESQPKEEPQPTSYPSDIVINEILPSPTGPDAQEEWLEIKNQNNFEINLSGWKIGDTAGKTRIYTCPQGTKISPLGFLVLSRPTTKITLNNDGDGLNLLQPDGKIVDSVNYEKAPQGKSYNRIESGWAWSNILTPGSANIVPSSLSESEKTQSVEKDEEIGKTEKEEYQKELAAVGEQLPKSSGLLPTILIASGIAIGSGILILFLKRKIKTEPKI